MIPISKAQREVFNDLDMFSDEEKALALALILWAMEESFAEGGRLADLYVIRETKKLLFRIAKLLSLEGCRDVLNANQYSCCSTWEVQGPWKVEGEYVVCGLADEKSDESSVRLTLFEATALARAFLLKGVR